VLEAGIAETAFSVKRDATSLYCAPLRSAKARFWGSGISEIKNIQSRAHFVTAMIIVNKLTFGAPQLAHNCNPRARNGRAAKPTLSRNRIKRTSKSDE
jgi:hypothetical protein